MTRQMRPAAQLFLLGALALASVQAGATASNKER